MGNKFKIIGPIFIGRSYDEYLKMFNLVKAVDILYDKDPSFLQKRCKYHLNALIELLSEMEIHFKWIFLKI